MNYREKMGLVAIIACHMSSFKSNAGSLLMRVASQYRTQSGLVISDRRLPLSVSSIIA